MKKLTRARTHDVAIQYRMAAGIPGNVTRLHTAQTEPQVLDTVNYPLAYGLPVIIDATSHGVRGITAGDSRVDGFYVRPYPITGNGTDGLGTSTPPVAGLIDILKSGYMTILLGGSAAAVKQGLVYVRTANPSTGKVVGDIEAAPDQGVTASAFTGTGTQTIGTLSAAQTPELQTPAGIYTVTLTATSSTAAFNVTDADGAIVGTGKIGTQCTLDNGLSFLVTAAGTPTTGDHATVTVANNTFVLSRKSYFTGPADSAGNVEIAFNI